MKITDRTLVRVLDGQTETWRGTLLQFERDNAFEDAECAEVRTSLAFEGSHTFDLGAGGVMTVALVARHRRDFSDGDVCGTCDSLKDRPSQPRNEARHDVSNGRHPSNVLPASQR